MLSIQLLTADAGDTLTATFTDTSKAPISVESESQLQFDIDYTPHADNVGVATCYAEWELLYSRTPSLPVNPAGDPATQAFKSYVVENDVSVGSGVFVSEFLIKRWRAYADDTDGKDRDPTFSVPLGSRAIKLSIREVGASTKFGTFRAALGRQKI